MDILLQDDIKLVEDRIKSFEENTGCELLLVVAESSDEYPGAIWRFGIFFGFAVTLLFSAFFEFHHGYYWPLLMLVSIYLGRWLAFLPLVKRLTLDEEEMNRETMEKAKELFYSLGTSQVDHKVTAMIMVSLYEKKIIVLVDEKLKSKITQEELDELITIMRPHFVAKNMGIGLIQSIESLEQKILNDFNGKVSGINPSELKNMIHFI